MDMLVDTVSRIQRDMAILREENRSLDIGNREPQTHFGHGAGVISGGISKYMY